MPRRMLHRLFEMVIKASSNRPYALQHIGDMVTLCGNGGEALEARV